MRIATEKHATLEMRGPRDGWRPALDRIYGTARELVSLENYTAGIVAAETAHVKTHGDMHGFSFRVVETAKSIIGRGQWSDVVPV